MHRSHPAIFPRWTCLSPEDTRDHNQQQYSREDHFDPHLLGHLEVLSGCQEVLRGHPTQHATSPSFPVKHNSDTEKNIHQPISITTELRPKQHGLIYAFLKKRKREKKGKGKAEKKGLERKG